jgi:hypothetical protein
MMAHVVVDGIDGRPLIRLLLPRGSDEPPSSVPPPQPPDATFAAEYAAGLVDGLSRTPHGWSTDADITCSGLDETVPQPVHREESVRSPVVGYLLPGLPRFVPRAEWEDPAVHGALLAEWTQAREAADREQAAMEARIRTR